MKLLACALLVAMTVVGAGGAQADEKERSRTENPMTIVGVVDQTGAKTFVIAGDERIQPKAVLHGREFSDDNFARFLGMRVRMKGELVTEGEQKVFYVRNLTDIERLGPEEPRRK